MTYEEAREASAAFIRDLDPDARRMWEIAGPKNTAIRQMECWVVRCATEGRPRVLVIQLFGGRGGADTGGGWLVLAEVGPNSIAETKTCLQRLDRLEAVAQVPAPAETPIRDLTPQDVGYELMLATTLDAWGTEIILPKGTKIVKVPGPGGGFAVSSKQLLIRLTGNTHDPEYRYLWVPVDLVQETPKP